MTERRDGAKRWSRRASALIRVLSCAGIGIAVGVVAAMLTPWQVATLVAWDVTALLFCAWVWAAVHGVDAETTRHIATREDDSRAAAEVILIAAGLASLLGVGLALLKASTEIGTTQALITAVAVVTVGFSWLAVHTIFTLRYAHLYYREGGGIDFHDNDDPDYADFAYVAFTIGMTFQVSDTDFTSKIDPQGRAATRVAVLRVRHRRDRDDDQRGGQLDPPLAACPASRYARPTEEPGACDDVCDVMRHACVTLVIVVCLGVADPGRAGDVHRQERARGVRRTAPGRAEVAVLDPATRADLLAVPSGQPVRGPLSVLGARTVRRWHS